MSNGKRDIKLPQGKYRVGRDIPEGVYLIGALNDYSFIKIKNADDEEWGEYYNLGGKDSKICHVEIANGDALLIDGNVIIRFIKSRISDSPDCVLFQEIDDFQDSVNSSAKKIKVKIPTEDDEEDDQSDSSENEWEEDTEEEEADDPDEELEEELLEDECDTEDIYCTPSGEIKFDFWEAMKALPSSDSGFRTSEGGYPSEKKHSGKCDGDCANCPPHYGYRHGRWYYGHSHTEGCVFGGNKNNGGRD